MAGKCVRVTREVLGAAARGVVPPVVVAIVGPSTEAAALLRKFGEIVAAGADNHCQEWISVDSTEAAVSAAPPTLQWRKHDQVL